MRSAPARAGRPNRLSNTLPRASEAVIPGAHPAGGKPILPSHPLLFTQALTNYQSQQTAHEHCYHTMDIANVVRGAESCVRFAEVPKSLATLSPKTGIPARQAGHCRASI